MSRRLVTLTLCLLLAACASPSREHYAAQWSGRIGLRVQTEPPQSLQAGFELQGNAQSGQLTLLSPVGSTLARLSWQPGQAILERGSERWTGPSVQDLAEQLTQTPLPVQALFDWIEGREVTHAGWQPDLSELQQGRILARRTEPEPRAQLRIMLDR